MATNQVTGISSFSSAGSNIRAGKTVVFTLSTQQPVTVTGMPQLTLNNGGRATYSGVDGTGKPQFTYTVAPGDDTSDLKVTGFAANGGSIGTAGTFQLASKVDYATGTGPISVTSADLNGDGKADLVVGNETGATVSVLLGNGDGTFRNKVDYTTGSYPAAIEADVNGDGKQDVIAVNYNSNTVSILLGNGNGTFQPKVDYATGGSPVFAAAGDLNGDGKIDLAVTNSGSATVSVFIGNGNGTFQGKVDYTTGSQPYSPAITDLNRDGKPDLVVANYASDTVSVLLGNGNGTFQGKVDYAVGNKPFYVATADFNGDGNADAVTANSGSTNNISVLLGNGNGTFQGKVDYAAGTTPYSVAIADVDGDGKLDIVTANYGSNTASVFLGNGNGTFQPKKDFATSANPSYATTADLNGDGKADVIASNYGSNTVSILLSSLSPVDTSTIATAPGFDTGIVVDTMAPAGPSSLMLAPGQDTGSSSTDGITSVNTFDLTGTAQPNSSLNLYRDGGVLIGTTTVMNDGTYSFTTPALSDGLHSLYAAAVDRAGNRSTISPLIKVTVDTASPATPAAPTLSPASDTGVQGDDHTTIARPTLTGAAEAGSTVTLYDSDGTTVLGTAVASSSSTYAITSTTLSLGVHRLTVTSTDKAGNHISSGANNVTIDQLAPPSAPDLTARSDSGASSTDDLTNDKTPTFTGTTAANATVQLYEGNTLLGTGRSDANGIYSVTSSALGDGMHTLQVKATDPYGNVSNLSNGTAISIDTSAPAAASSPALTMASDTGTSSSDGITSDATPTVTGTAEAGSTVALYRDGGILVGSMTLAANATAYSFTTPTLSDGLHSLYARATDAAGNLSPVSVLRKVTIDTAAPNVAIDGNDRTVMSASQTITGTGEAGTVVTLSDNNAVVGTATVASNGTWSKAVTLSTGTNNFTATDTDKAGNVGNSNTVNVTYMPASAMRSLHSMVQAMATMNPAASSALTPSVPAAQGEAHLAVAHA